MKSKQIKQSIQDTQNVMFLFPQKAVIKSVGKHPSFNRKCVKKDKLLQAKMWSLGYTIL